MAAEGITGLIGAGEGAAGMGSLGATGSEPFMPMFGGGPSGGPEDKMVTVSRWGREGLQPGDWILKGSPNFWNYLRSFKYQPGFGNQFAHPRTGRAYQVPASSIRWPHGRGIDGAWKGLFGHRIYEP